MLRKPLSWSVNQVCKMIDKGTITFDNPIQRPSGQWKDEDKCLLIDSLLTLFIPDIYALQIKKETGNTYDILEGKQRLTTIHSYLANEWALSEMPEIRLDSTNEKYNISGMKYSELPEEVKEEIKGYTIVIKAIELEDGDDEEEIVERVFYRLNNGKPVSREHLAFITANKDIQQFVKRQVTESPLFNDVAKFSNNSILKSDREMSVLQSIILVSGKEFSNFSAKAIEEFFSNNSIEPDVLDRLESVFISIAETFENQPSKFVNKINISSMAYLLYNNDANADSTESVMEFLRYYSENYQIGDIYKSCCGGGCTKKENVKGRMEAITKLYNDYLDKKLAVAV